MGGPFFVWWRVGAAFKEPRMATDRLGAIRAIRGFDGQRLRRAGR